MSAKLKLFLIVILSIFATAATGVYITQRQPSEAVSSLNNGQVPQFSDANIAQEIVNSERANYNTIPLESINSPLQGSDPADLAVNAFDNMDSTLKTRKVEVFYPYPNQALVTITQIEPAKNFLKAIKYRVELTTFGRSFFVSSPRVWQIVWAGSQVQCISGSSLLKRQSTQICQ
ncbi:MAG: hypothetical protein KME49_15740 [Brasilonema octagenarum HA4186-MV1]|jgi:hypothetical protein|uniref:Uncharacterized protein n=1 Tax=Brasilonema octagenarum UFV-OR1 TaxID=417115 RepID=A0ABX1MHJ0_9CYAN|nr:hypothetical protein [Brasilonema octagenarum]MBW4626907.1 hypothetical protein [Brasilonema octagenarum HA4186-MV1]NMF66219.1 hypothetical protein [Brasilonema octagenarum UFV-OR1]